MTEGGDAETMVRAYCELRLRWFQELGSLPEVAQEILGHIDVVTDAFWADDDPGRGHALYAIGEDELRVVLQKAVEDLKRCGYLSDPPANLT